MRSAAQRTRALSRGLVAALAVVAGTLLAYGLLGGRDDEIEARAADDERGYYLTEATLTEMGADGAPRIVLRSELIEQRLADQNVLLSDLTLDYNTADSATGRSPRTAAACSPMRPRCGCRATWSSGAPRRADRR